MLVPRLIHPEISKEDDVRKGESRYPRDTVDAVPIQEVEIIEGSECSDYVYLRLSFPPAV